MERSRDPPWRLVTECWSSEGSRGHGPPTTSLKEGESSQRSSIQGDNGRGYVESELHDSSNDHGILFWNVHGLQTVYDSIDTELNGMLANCVIVCLNETWRLENEIVLPLPFKKFQGIVSPATKDFTRGRGIGSMCVLYDEDIVTEFELLDNNTIWIAAKCIIQGKDFILVNVYIRERDFADRLKLLADGLRGLAENYECPVLVGGDFNSRIGNLNQLDECVTVGSSFTGQRQARDVKMNKNGILLVENMEEIGLFTLNGHSRSDEEGVHFLGKRQ